MSTILAGLAGDTDPGRFLSSGLWRSRDGGPWERCERGLPPAPEVRALLVLGDRLLAGLQDGVYGSDDGGGTWQRLPAPAPGDAVWGLARVAGEPGAVLAGYEPAALALSRDGGATWQAMPVDASYPHVATEAGQPKRIIGIAAQGDVILAGVEIGGLLRSDDGGRSWTQALDGLYVVDDAVDLHAVLLGDGGAVTVATRVGAFRSDDGRRWRRLPVPALREKGSYCRVLAEGADGRLFVGGGNDFDGDRGALWVSGDGGGTFRAVDLGMTLKGPVFGLAVSAEDRSRVACSDKFGHVFLSDDGGDTWTPRPLPRGAGHVFALAVR